MNVIIASDFHLKFRENAEDRERRDHVLAFLRSLRGQADLLILNGDVFDLWLEWGQVTIAGYYPLFEVFSELRHSGCRIALVAGNHDFLFGDFLPRHIGIELYPEAFREEIDGRKYYVAHGDSYTSNDLRYQVYRRIVRSRAVYYLARILHPDLVLRLGTLMSRSSRNVPMSAELQQRKEAGLLNKAKHLSAKYDLIVFGHSHIPRNIPLERGVYFNSGDWIRHRTYIRIVDGRPELLEYPL